MEEKEKRESILVKKVNLGSFNVLNIIFFYRLLVIILK